MSNYLEEDWVTPNTTPFPDFSNPFEHSNFTPATTVPSHAPDTIFLKPRQSPRTFSGNVQDLVYTNHPAANNVAHQGLGISASPQFSSFHPTVSSPPMRSYSRTSDVDLARQRSSTAPSQTPLPSLTSSHSGPVPIAPNPVGVQQLQQMKQMKRIREESVEDHSSKRRRSSQTSQTKPANELSEEEELLLRLKQDEGLPWKDIAQQFEVQLGKTYQVPALQMRFKRLRERMRTWTEEDLRALKEAYDYWEKSKYEIIAQKVRCVLGVVPTYETDEFAQMLDFGAQEKWPARSCEKKWEELNPDSIATGGLPTAPTFESGRWFQDPLESEYDTPQPDISRTPRQTPRQTPRRP